METKLFSSGYGKNTDVILSGELQATVNSASISNLSLCTGDPIRLCSLDLDVGNVYYMCESTLSNTHAQISHRLRIPTEIDQLSMQEGLEDALIVDTSHKNAVFTRTINAKSKIKFSLSLPQSCQAFYYKSYKLAERSLSCVMVCASKGAPTLNSSFLTKDTRMLIVMVGAITYDKNEGAFYTREGYSGLAFIAADPSKFASVGEKAYYYLWTRDEKYLQTEKLAVAHLNCRMSNGAVFSSGADRRIYLEDLPDAVRAFSLAKDFESAQNAILAVNKLSDEGRCFYPCYPWVSENSDGVAAVYFIYAVMQYHIHSGDDKFVNRLYNTLKNAMMTVLDAVKDNMLPEISTSPLYEIELLGESTRYHGSAVSTAMCIDAFDWLCTYFKKTAHRLEKTSINLRSVVDEMTSAFEDNFVYKDRISHNSPKREAALRRTRFAYGRCKGCADHGTLIYEGILERTNKGAYLCPECFGEHSDKYAYEKGKRVYTPLALAQVTRSKILRDYIGQEKLSVMLWQYFEAYKNDLPLRVTKEDAYLLECAILLDKEKQADAVKAVIDKNADELDRYQKFCDNNGSVGNDFHSGSCAAIYNALENYSQYKDKKRAQS